MAKRILKFVHPYTTRDMPLVLRGVDFRKFKDRAEKYGYSDRFLDKETIELTATDERLLDEMAEEMVKSGKVVVVRTRSE